MNALAAFDDLLAVLESQGHQFASYEELEAFLARVEAEADDSSASPLAAA